MTGYQDYLILLSPPEQVLNSVKQLKSSCARLIGDYEGRYSTAHITVQYCPRKNSNWIAPLLTKLKNELQNLPPIILEIEGFGFFKNQNNATIYAKIKSSILTEVWFKQLGKHINKNDITPHITIARNIQIKAFSKLWPYFQNLKWNERLKIDEVTILSRETIGHDKIYKVSEKIPFNPRLNFHSFANSKIKQPLACSGKVVSEQFSLFHS